MRAVGVHPGEESMLLAAARRGDGRAFERLTKPYRRELHIHCYRMLGSLDDADDAVQDALIRAWRQLGRFEDRSRFRGWLYRIATNVCLKALAARRRANQREGRFGRSEGRLDPYPDVLLDEASAIEGAPEEEVARRENVELAFLAAVQLLPPKQRAVLVLREALGFSAAEVAEVLDTTVAAANSALQRARDTLEREREAGHAPPSHRPASEDVERALVDRFVRAWHAVDVDGIVTLLAKDAVITMPPGPDVAGREAIRAFLRAVPADGKLDELRLLRVRANRQPAVAAYAKARTEGWDAYGIMVFTIRDSKVATISGFAEPSLFPRFGLLAALAE
jgi:RNA polymerase sigma-70 factor, ECF subfamily